jgi:hypothetical protein
LKDVIVKILQKLFVLAVGVMSLPLETSASRATVAQYIRHGPPISQPKGKPRSQKTPAPGAVPEALDLLDLRYEVSSGKRSREEAAALVQRAPICRYHAPPSGAWRSLDLSSRFFYIRGGLEGADASAKSVLKKACTHRDVPVFDGEFFFRLPRGSWFDEGLGRWCVLKDGDKVEFDERLGRWFYWEEGRRFEAPNYSAVARLQDIDLIAVGILDVCDCFYTCGCSSGRSLSDLRCYLTGPDGYDSEEAHVLTACLRAIVKHMDPPERHTCATAIVRDIEEDEKMLLAVDRPTE